MIARPHPLLPLLFTGCRALPVYVLPETETPEARETIEAGAALLEVPIRFVDAPAKAAVTVEFIKPADGICGHASRRRLCLHEIRTCSGRVFAGHEFGHAFGLDHTCEKGDECPGTLMDYAPPNVDPIVTTEQKATAQRNADLLAACKEAKR